MDHISDDKKWTFKMISEWVFHISTLLVTLSAAAIAANARSEVVQLQSNIESYNSNISTLITEINTNNENSNTNIMNTSFNEAEKTPQTLLQEAIYAFDAQMYDRVFVIYSNDKISNTQVALTNMGYLYENGYGVSQDFERARECFDKAIILGFEPAYTHKLAMYFKYSLPGVEDVLYEGYKRNSVSAANFIASFFPDYAGTPMEILEMFCTSYNSDEQLDFFEQYIWEWKDYGYRSYDKPPFSSDIQEYVRVNDIQDIERGGRTRVYKVFKKETRNIQLIDRGFYTELE